MKCEVVKCDRCETFKAEPRAVDLVVRANSITVDAAEPASRVNADLCDTCWAGVGRAVKRAMSKPVPRAKGGADTQ